MICIVKLLMSQLFFFGLRTMEKPVKILPGPGSKPGIFLIGNRNCDFLFYEWHTAITRCKTGSAHSVSTHKQLACCLNFSGHCEHTWTNPDGWSSLVDTDRSNSGRRGSGTVAIDVSLHEVVCSFKTAVWVWQTIAAVVRTVKTYA
jgi:hypothetical protein